MVPTPYLQSVIVSQVGLHDMDVGTPLQLCVFGYLVERRSLVSDNTDDGVVRVLAAEGEESVLLDDFSMRNSS